MFAMTRLEKAEVTIIILLSVFVYLYSATSFLLTLKPLGTVLMWSAALLLAQSLLRDLWLLRSAGKSIAKTSGKSIKQQKSCMCFESAIGAAFVIIGALLLLFCVGGHVLIQAWVWPVASVAILTFGFLSKDLVFGWRPWRIERDVNHLNTLFKW